jgi:disulfide bond formation protein DsbB
MSGVLSNPTRIFALAATLSATAVAIALVSQHVFDMQPCPWCALQRLIFVLLALLALVGLFWRNRAARLASAGAMDLLATCGAASALWQHYVAAASQSCNFTLADKILSGLRLDAAFPEVFAPRASCAEAVASLFGVPYEFWSLTLFVVIAILAMLALLAMLGRRPAATRA